VNPLLAQIAEVSELVAKVGWPGVVLWVVVTRLDRIEHAMKDFSAALWLDLASRPGSEDSLKQKAQERVAQLKNEKL